MDSRDPHKWDPVMNRQDLKQHLTPLVIAKCGGDESAINSIAKLAREWMDSDERIHGGLDVCFDVWNQVMLEIIQENNLGKH